MARPRTLVASNYNAWRRPYNNLIYEFCHVIMQSEEADLLAPGGLLQESGHSDIKDAMMRGAFELRRALSKARFIAGLQRFPEIKAAHVRQTYDLFFYICPFVHDLANLQAIHGWKEKCGLKGVFILESWSSLLHKNRAHLRVLDEFDYVFLLNKASVPNVQRYTKAKCVYLPTAADCLTASPWPNPEPRVIDVYCMGRRAPAPHAQLVDMAAQREIFYVYDAVTDATVIDWRQSRLLTANFIRRSRYFLAFDHMIGSASKAHEAGEERSISTRYFEGAAGGAVMIGSKPDCPEFDECFDWQDAVIDIPSVPEDMRVVLAELDAQPERMNRIRQTNAIQALKRHDWSHRWITVLQTFGLEQGAKSKARTSTLDSLAMLASRDTGPLLAVV